MERVVSTKQAQIKFSTEIIKRLGEELNPSIDQSILELVKNSYDADAKMCIVELDKITKTGGSIIIKDDGNGMDANAIAEGWLVLGKSSKSVKKKTKLGRIPAGSKGLGRLAAIRMGNIAELQSTPNQLNASRFDLIIDWKKFDNAKLVEEVFLPIKETKVLAPLVHGSIVTIKKLKQKIGEREVRKIARGLILLADPFEDDPNAFKPVLHSKEFKVMERMVSRRYFDEADYHLVASIDKKGKASASILDYRGNVLFKANHKELVGKRKSDKYNCPPTTFDLWVFILNATSFSTRTISLSEVREWLGEFGGVHLYENGLRVNPYGNPGNDWLDMNLARAKSPEEKPSTNTSIGVVRVKDSRGLLSQKTNRSGFIETDVFHEIRNFCQDALAWMAKERLEIAEQKRRSERERVTKESVVTKQIVLDAINRLAPKKKDELLKLFNKYEKSNQDEVKSLKSEVQLYRTLSTAGITAATFSHESRGNPLKVITQAISAIERRAKDKSGKDYETIFSKPVNSITRAVSSLSVLGSATLKLLDHEKRRVARVEIHEVINNVLDTFSPFLKGREINVKSDLTKGKPFLRSSEAAIESILTNLLNNSIVALENSTTKSREILIRTMVEEDILTLTVCDNGKGIEDISLKDIWLPGQTTNPNGTGLGLTIVRDAVFDLGGSVSAEPHGELGGAEILIELPIIGL